MHHRSSVILLLVISPILAGAQVYPDENIQVMVSGSTTSSLAVPLSINSPDINGDLMVNLSDVTFFVMALGGTYDWRSDFNVDGVVNLSDVTVMAHMLGMICP